MAQGIHRHSRSRMTAAREDYLREIYLLASAGAEVTTQTLADRLGVAAPSVTQMLQRLRALELLVYQPYHPVQLTAAGAAVAATVVARHELIEAYLIGVLGFPAEAGHREADRLEHVMSEQLEACLRERLPVTSTTRKPG